MSTNPKKTIDWEDVHRRIELARQSTRLGWTPSAEEKQRIFRMRAKSLAVEPVKQAIAGMTMDVVSFLLADETYGIELGFVREIHPLKAFTPLPCTPAFVLGLVNLRGQILSVINLKKFFEIPEKGLTELNKIIVLQRDDMEFGILADVVLGVQSVPRDHIQPGLATLTGIREAYLKGITRERLVILNGERILSDKNIVVNEQVEGWRK
jgi:purine-binding chemotaxis protein CheW